MSYDEQRISDQIDGGIHQEKAKILELFQISKTQGVVKPKDPHILFSRKVWEVAAEMSESYSFTKEQLDAAELSSDGLIAERCGVLCYLQRPLNLT